MPRRTATTTSCTTFPSAKAWNTFVGTIPNSTSAIEGTVPTVPSTCSVSCIPTPGRSRAIAPIASDMIRISATLQVTIVCRLLNRSPAKAA